MIQLGLLEGTRSALKSNRPSTPCRQCSPRLRSREQERIRPRQNDRNCKDSPAINAAYSVLKGVNNMHFGSDLPRVGNRPRHSGFLPIRVPPLQSQSLRQSFVLPPSQIEIY